MIYGKDSEKDRVNRLGNENNIIWFLGSVIFRKYYFELRTQKEIAKCMNYYHNDKCFLVLVIYMFVMFLFFFLQKEEINRSKRASWPKFCNIVFFVFQKECRSPEDLRTKYFMTQYFFWKYFMTTPINCSFLFKAFL